MMTRSSSGKSMIHIYRNKIDRLADTFDTTRRWLKRERMAPPAEWKSEIGQLLWTVSPPLIHPGRRFVVIFSAKSACTNVLIWFLTQLGHAAAARDFHIWPHEYRETVYYFSQLYRDAFRQDLSDFKIIRVVRDPFERAASSFRHVVRFDLADRDIGRKIGVRNLEQDGLSFSEFLSFLERTDLRSCNPHFSLQHQPLEERFAIDYLIDVSREDLFGRLNQIESELNLMTTSLKDDPWVKELRSHNRPSREIEGGEEVYTRRLTRIAARKGPWPRNEDLLTDEARSRISKLYAKDLASYF